MNGGKETFDFGDAKFVGIAGRRGAGKDLGAKHLADKHGFLHMSTSNMLREVARKKDLDADDSDVLISLGIELREEYGSQGALVIMAAEKWQRERENYEGGLVVTAMRAVGEAQEIIARRGLLLYAEAQMELCHQRIVSRMRDDEALQPFKHFAQHSIMEEMGDKHDPTRPNLGAIKKMSHKVLYNDHVVGGPFLLDIDRAIGLPPCDI